MASYICIFSFIATVFLYSRRNSHASSFPNLHLPLNQLLISNSFLLTTLAGEIMPYYTMHLLKKGRPICSYTTLNPDKFGFPMHGRKIFGWYSDRLYKISRLLSSVHVFYEIYLFEKRREEMQNGLWKPIYLIFSCDNKVSFSDRTCFIVRFR